MQPAEGDAGGSEPGANRVDIIERPRDDAEFRRIDRSDFDIAAQMHRDGFGVSPHGHHRAVRLVLHQPSAVGDQPQTVLEGNDVGKRCRNEFADAVADHVA